MSKNPVKDVKEKIKKGISEVLGKEIKFHLEPPANPEYGHLSTDIFFKIGRDRRKIEEIMEKLRELEEVEKVEFVNGFLNIRLSKKFFETVLNSILKFKEEFGREDIGKGKKVCFEYVSPNPVHPLHIGHARNAVIGGTLSRVFEFLGYEVQRRCYINDRGKQVAILAYSYRKLKDLIEKIKGKIDHRLGILYSCTATAIERKKINVEEKIKEKYKELSKFVFEILEKYPTIDVLDIIKEEWIEVEGEILRKWPEVYLKVREIVEEDADKKVKDLIFRYDRKEKEIVGLFREVCEKNIEGFKETLERIREWEFDLIDWESELVWSGKVRKILERLKKYIKEEEGTLLIDFKELKDKKLRGLFGELPKLTLTRSDGTPLYTTTDIAYSLEKIRENEVVFNVIGAEQKVAQKQLKACLYLLNEPYNKIVHVGYELVRLPGKKISSRRGRYITLDQIIEMAKIKAYEEISKRWKNLSEKEKLERAEKIAIGAVKFALLIQDPNKVMEFDIDKVVSFKEKTGPFVQYSYARASSIIRKAETEIKEFEIKSLEKEEEDLIWELARFPEILVKVHNDLKPNYLAIYANNLSKKFNRFYEKCPVLGSEEREKRLAIVEAFRIILKNILKLLGIPVLEVM